MKNTLAVIAFVVIAFAAVGWYLNWYGINLTPTPEGRHKVTIDLNTPRITEDLQKGREQVVKLLKKNEQPEGAANTTNTNAAPFPTFTNPLPRPQTPQPGPAQNPPAAKTQQPNPDWVPFEINEEGYFVLPGYPKQ
jgi:hypothetical protein